MQLQRFLSQNVLQSEFQFVEMPAQADDVRFVDPAKQPAFQDMLVQPADSDRCAALQAVRRANRLALNAAQDKELAERLAGFQIEFAIPDAVPTPSHGAGEGVSTRAHGAGASVNISLSELKRFLQLPAQESLRRHLRVEEEFTGSQTDLESQVDDQEPLVTTQQVAGDLIRQTIQHLVLSAAKAGASSARRLA